ncbi:MAG: hypothetical protein U9R37_06885 [Campylobacterota bacterium]|nr:hypothetical protein [Campylobacterota bacterium]
MPNLFEEFVDTTGLKYYVKNISEGVYLGFAYDESKIIDGIKNSNLTMGQIRNIYFGQIELESLVKTEEQTCMKIDNICLGYANDILVQIPLMLNVQTSNDIDISDIKLSNDKIYVNSASKYIDTKLIYKISTIVFLFSVVIFTQLLINKQTLNNIPNKIENIKTKSNMPSTMIQTKSIVKKLKKTVLNQTVLRDAFKEIIDISSKNKAKLTSIKYKEKKITFKIENLSIDKIRQLIGNKYAIKNIKTKDSVVITEIKL